MKKIEVTLYEYKELSDRAKKKARAWYNEFNLDYNWWEPVYEDAKAFAKFLGIQIDSIHFSGFSSQGDGACFNGTFRPEDVKTVEDFETEYLQEQEEVKVIHGRISKVKCPEDCRVNISVNGLYSHSHSMRIDPSEEMERDEERELLSCLRVFADWIYKTLETDYEYLISDENVEEELNSNEYLFLEDGSRCTLGD